VQKKLFFRLFLALGIIGVASCSNSMRDSNGLEDVYFSDEQSLAVSPSRVEGRMYNNQYMAVDNAQYLASNPEDSAKIFNKRVPKLNSLIVCRDKQCAPADLAQSKEYIFNSLAQLVDNNLDATALLCEANPQAHVCVNQYITVPAKVGITPVYVYFDGVKLVDASIVDGKPAIRLALNYNMSYNGQTPNVCKPDEAMLYVKNNKEVVLNGNGFKCEMTSMGTTIIRVLFNVDYIDLDYGYIGGYYSIGLSGPATGGGSGYGIIRMQENAYPLNPVLTSSSNKVEEESSTKKPENQVVKPDVKDLSLKISDEKDSALANVEIKSEEPLVDENSSEENVDSDYPNGMSAESIVRDNKIVLRPEPTDLRPIEVNSQGFDEVSIDELDEYIK
jgi:hypothetical protein